MSRLATDLVSVVSELGAEAVEIGLALALAGVMPGIALTQYWVG